MTDSPATDGNACAGTGSSLLPEVDPLSPHLVCKGAAQAIAFYAEAFGATELVRMAAPDGRLMHACLRINGATVMLVDEFPEMGNRSPLALAGTPVTLHMMVADVDAASARAVAAGARVIVPVADMFWGDRYGVVEDPFGHRWSIATRQKTLTTSEALAAMGTAACG